MQKQMYAAPKLQKQEPLQDITASYATKASSGTSK